MPKPGIGDYRSSLTVRPVNIDHEYCKKENKTISQSILVVIFLYSHYSHANFKF